MAINDSGVVLCRRNGKTRKLGKIQLFDFDNINGLASKDSLLFHETPESGKARPTNEVSIVEGFLEQSNVDEKPAVQKLDLAKSHLRLIQANLQYVLPLDACYD